MGKKSFAVILVSALLPAMAVAQTTVVYPPVPGLGTSAEYSARVNGQEVWVEEIGPGGMENLNVANFSC